MHIRKYTYVRMYIHTYYVCVCVYVCDSMLLFVTVLAKTHLVRTQTEFNLIAAVYRHTQYLSIPFVSSVKC